MSVKPGILTTMQQLQQLQARTQALNVASQGPFQPHSNNNIDVGIRRTAPGRERPPNVETTKRHAAIGAESRSPAAGSHEGGLSPTPTPTRGNLLRRKTAVPPDLQPPSGVASCGATLATSRQTQTPRHPSYGAIRCAPSRDTPTLQPGNCPAELPRAPGLRPARRATQAPDDKSATKGPG
uniref:Uncharacterized protein n=1 Tax=Glossina austeni TaxID=7395 RepID=A0A1A9UWL8_GLOAU